MPEYTHKMTEEFFNGNVKEACKMQLDSLDLIKALFSEVNPIPVKKALNFMGYQYGDPRLPLIPMSESKAEKLKEKMERFKLI